MVEEQDAAELGKDWHEPTASVLGKVFGVGFCEMTVGDDGRIAIPRSLRYGINSRLVGTAWFDHCLIVCNISNWDKVLADLLQRETPSFSPWDVERLFNERSFTSSVDKMHRILIPSQFRAYAGITNKAMVLGLGDRLEIWNTTHWQDYKRNLMEQAKEIMPELPLFLPAS